MLCLNRTKTYTIHEFFELEKKKEFDKLEKLIIMSKKNEKLRKVLIGFGLGLLFVWENLSVVLAADDPFKKLDPLGNRFIGILQHIGYYVCIIMCILEILKALGQGDTKGAGKIFIKYLLAYLALMGVQTAFDQVRYVFQN